MKKWILRKKSGNIDLMCKALNINKIVAQVLINRGITNKKLAQDFINVDLNNFYDFDKALGVLESYEIIKESLSKNEKIVIYGDYDVDGVMSTTILYKGLKGLGANVSYYIPDRESEGYGLNKNALKSIKGFETDLIITCDNGITGLEEVLFGKELGLKIVIIDHHEPLVLKHQLIPEADAVIDPKQLNCQYDFKEMCAAGLCYRFITGLYKNINKKLLIHDELLVFAMIATFCDIVNLNEDNRIIAKTGLEIINKEVTNIGLKTLIMNKNISDKELTSYDIGFIIGPCINATGRLLRASIGVDLFTTEDQETAQELSEKLVSLNEKRKEMTQKSVENILESLEESEVLKDDIFVLFDKNIHESIAGIVAGRIKDKYYHPTIVLTEGDGFVKGSARSIESYDIFEGLSKCQKYFEKFGGHKMAAGLSLKYENIEPFRKEINKNSNLEESDFCEIVPIDSQLELEDITYKIAEEMFILKPFGKNNKEPLFGSKNILVEKIKMIENKNTIIFTFRVNEYREINGICFGMVNEFKNIIYENYEEYFADKIFHGILRNVDLRLDLVYYIDVNEYNNNLSVQLKIKDFRLSN